MPYLILIILFVLLVLLIDAAPVPDVIHPTQNWGPNPNSRGTLSILFSCGSALIFCVWTAVQLNIDPSSGTKRGKIEMVPRYLGRAMWATIALLAPDIVLSVALHQFLVAREYRRAVNNFIKSDSRVQNEIDPRYMELRMAFFATMGGFCYEDNTINGPRWTSLKIDTLRGFRAMDRIHDCRVPEMRDGNGATSIAKTITIFTGWIVLQCFGRRLDNLHITLLELNTSLHVIIAIVMYAIWWEKPLDIGRPITIDGYGLGINSATTVYVDTLRANLIEAEKAVSSWVQPENAVTFKGTESKGHTSGEIIKQKGSGKGDVVTVEEEVAHPKLLIAVAVFRSIGEAPTEAARLFKTFPVAIRKYFHDRLFKDIRSGVLQKYRRTAKSVETEEAGGRKMKEFVRIPEVIIPPMVSHAAFTIAYEVANETAFQVARERITSTAKEFRRADGNTNGPKTLEKALDDASQVTQKAAFKAAYVAAFATALAAESDHKSGSRRNSNTSTTNLQQTKPTLANHKDSSQEILMAAYRAATAAARAASRHAVRLVALDTALGYVSAADSAADALLKIATNNVQNSIPKGHFDFVVGKAHLAAGNAFREHFEISALDPTSDIDFAAEIVERATATGIYIAAQKAIAEAKAEATDPEVVDSCVEAEDILLEISYGRTRWQRLKSSFEAASAEITDQIIKVPDLFTLKSQKRTPKTGNVINEADLDENEEQRAFHRRWRKFHRIFLFLFSAFAGAFYGAIHLTKWNSPWFPTHVEHLLWRMSCFHLL
ncbi:hypothetical protein K440DRAFT_661557 [Wilcoxina mikolae CBS 423.85]|nr:hypothetical protein K440DRAFT_661557 [Wilcoxina mikolae CBS 423.85]